MLDHVLQGPPRFTHAFKAKADTRKKREPPTHPQQNEQPTQPSNASKEERKGTTRRNATETKRQTSKTEHQQDAGPRGDRRANHSSPNSRIKNQGLAYEHQRKKKRKTNKQTTRASNSHKLSKHKTHSVNNTKKNKSKTPAGERGTSRPTKGGKEIPTAPLWPTSHPPDPRRSREGRAISKRGVGGIPFHNLGTREPDQKEGRKRQTRKAPGPIANHPGPRSTMELDPGVEMQWAGGPRSSRNKGEAWS